MKTIIAFLFCSIIYISGCATKHYGQLGMLPKLVDPNMSGEIILIRDKSFVGSKASYIVVLDSYDIISIGSGQWTSIKVNPGDHTMGVKCPGKIDPSSKGGIVSFNLTQNDLVYVLVGPSMPNCKIELIGKVPGYNKKEKSTYVNIIQ